MVSVSWSVLLLPVWTEPKLKLDGLDVRAPAVTPEPERVQVSGEPVALELSVTDPAAFPATEGANITLKVVLWPADKVIGVVIPLRVNPAPVKLAWLIVTLEPPEFVTVAVCF